MCAQNNNNSEKDIIAKDAEIESRNRILSQKAPQQTRWHSLFYLITK